MEFGSGLPVEGKAAAAVTGLAERRVKNASPEMFRFLPIDREWREKRSAFPNLPIFLFNQPD
jgi:hypothetical protein